MERGAYAIVLQIVLFIFLINKCHSSQRDIDCLKQVKKSLGDPDNILNSSWNFQDGSEGFICKFNGVECWHQNESRVLNLRLSNMNLQGQFPLGLEDCDSMTGLDLSNNNLSGSLPSNISLLIPYVTMLDLSFNSFSGEIPTNMSNCTFLNVLNLQHNRLTGTIPFQFEGLNRLTSFNVADNLLSGQIPSNTKIGSFPASNFANNNGLCGKPLDVCEGRDIDCLKKVQQSLIDPDNNLKSSWIFQDGSEGFICKFSGVECWSGNESRVLNLRLSNMNLQGQFPLGLEDCDTLIGLDLSNNNLSGSLPSNISLFMPYLTKLDLSFNSFNGEIPINMSNFRFLNVLNLQHNRLTGTIPFQFAGLNRLTSFNVADNLLSGQIPSIIGKNGSFPASSFANNNGLCGMPLDVCEGAPSKINAGVIIGGAIGGVVVGVLVAGGVIFFLLRNIDVKKEKKVVEEKKRAKNLKGVKRAKVLWLDRRTRILRSTFWTKALSFSD